MRQIGNHWQWAVVASFVLAYTGHGMAWAAPQVPAEVLAVTDVFEFRSGVIIDSRRPAAYLMNPNRGIDALDLSAGKLLWRTANAAKPLLIQGPYLIAQVEPAVPANRLDIAVLDTQQDGDVLRKFELQLPRDVQAAISRGMETSFEASARAHGDVVIVSWRFSREAATGVPPGPDAKPQIRTGAARIDLETGDADTLSPDQVPPEAKVQLPENVARPIGFGTFPGPFWQVGNVVAALQRISDSRGKRAILKRWNRDTGRPLPEVVLFGADLTYHYPSADVRHLLASKRLDPPNAGWVWHIYSTASGAPVAEIRHASPAAWFFLTAASVVHEAPPMGRIVDGTMHIDRPLRLRAIDLETGNELWERPFRDTAYRGSYPPAGPGGARTP